jgi:hypothetical protein
MTHRLCGPHTCPSSLPPSCQIDARMQHI